MTLTETRLLQLNCRSNLLFFTSYFYRQRYGRPFVVGDHHRIICDTLERVYRGEVTRLIINIAPRYGKTELAVKNFIAKGLAMNPAARFIHLSYSEDLALDNSADCKELVQHEEYRRLFPAVQIRADTRAKNKWYTTARGGVYATSAGGQVTGFGAGQVDAAPPDLDEFAAPAAAPFGGALIIDDPIKPEDAESELLRNRVNSRYDSTISTRVNSRNTPIIIIMQRLHEQDLCGYLLGTEPQRWTVVSLPAIRTDGQALWPFKHTINELQELQRRNPVVFERQYLQAPVPLAGRLYKTFRTYEALPPAAGHTKCCIDTADAGGDYLCCILYRPCREGFYITDIYYTAQGMEVTEQETARLLTLHHAAAAKIESNNGGRTFARNVERACRHLGNTRTRITWYHQSQNKMARILTRAADVQNMIYYPAGWEARWPAFAAHVKAFMAAGRNFHDDAPDCLTMICEEETTHGARTPGPPNITDSTYLQWIDEYTLNTPRRETNTPTDDDVEEFYRK